MSLLASDDAPQQILRNATISITRAANQVSQDCHDAYTHLSNAYRLYFPDPSKSTRTSILTDSQVVHTSHSLTAFTIFPVNAQHVAVNRLLWHTAQRGYYNSKEASATLKTNVVTLGLPPQLYRFLSQISLREMYTAMTDFLVLLHHQLVLDDDADALENFSNDLYAPVLQHVLQHVGRFPRGEPGPGRRADLLEQIVQLCFLTPWQIGVFGAYLVPNHRDCESASKSSLTWGQIARQMWVETPSEPALVEMMIRHRNTSTQSRSIEPIANGMDEGAAVIQLHNDWIMLYKFLQCTGVPPGGVTEALHRAVDSDRGMQMMQCAITVVELANVETSFFSWLSTDILIGCVVPWLVRRQLEAAPPRSIMLLSLKSLLDRSARVFEEVRGVSGRGSSPIVEHFDTSVIADNVESIIRQNAGQHEQSSTEEDPFLSRAAMP